MSMSPLVTSPSPLMTTDEVAQRLNCSRKLVYRLIHAGSLPAVKTSDAGRAQLKVDERDLEQWIREHRGVGRG
jgi:excisionase family DNA binding protein